MKLRDGSKTLNWGQNDGVLYVGNGGYYTPLGVGYAGAPGFVNSGAQEHLKSLGPLPRGEYRLLLSPHNRFAAPAFRLQQVRAESSWFGRSGFWIHGDNAKRNRSASSGCIILDKDMRLAVKALYDIGFHTLICTDRPPF